MKPQVRVLIVEDSEDDTLLLVRHLRQIAAEVSYERVASEQEFIAALGTGKWDLVLCDYTMPGFSGMKALQVLRERDDETPFIFVSGTIGEDTAVQAMKAGANDYILKGIMKRFTPAVERELRDAEERREKKKLEMQLRRNEERFRALIENSSDAIAVIGRGGHITYISPSAIRMTGFSRREFEEKNAFDFIHPDDRQGILSLFDRLMSLPREIIKTEFRVAYKTGGWQWFDCSASNFSDDPAVGGVVLNFHNIHDRKTAEKALRASEEQYRSVVTAMSEGIVLQDESGMIQTCNASAERLLGLTKEQMEGRTSLDPRWHAIHEDGTPFPGEAHPAMVTLRSGRPCSNVIMGVQKPDGSFTWLSINSQPLFHDLGDKPYGVVTSFTDITDRRIADESLRISEQKYRDIVDFAPVGIYQSLYDGTIATANNALASMLGYDTVEDLIKVNMQDLYVDRKDRQRLMEQNEGQGYGKDIEVQWKKRDGTSIWVNLDVHAVKDSSRRMKYFEGFVRDVTEFKKGVDTLRLQTTAIQSAANAVMITDFDGTIVSINSAFARLTGYSEEEVLGKNPRFLSSGRQTKAFYETLWKTILSGHAWHNELVNKRKDGSLYAEEMTVTPVRDKEDRITHFVAIKQDVTERKNLEEQLLRSQKIESLGILAGGIAHDFNNILGILMGHVSLMERVHENAQQFRASLDAIDRALKRGTSLVRQLLTFARKTDIVLEPVFVNDVVRELVRLIRETFPKTIEIVTALSDQLPPIIADSGQIHQVLLNLCVNARDAMPGGGRLHISTRTIVGSRIRQRFPKAASEEYISIEVRDTGTGMDEVTKARLFEPFFTTKEAGKGTGLGLAVVFGIIQSHRGLIDVESEPGKGSAFLVYLPYEPAKAGDTPSPAARIDEARGGNENILLVEDEPLLYETMRMVLSGKGYGIFYAKDGAEAIELFENHGSEINLVLTDMDLPKLSGLKLIEALIKKQPRLKIIVASGYLEPEVKASILQRGVKAFLPKPFEPATLLARVREILDIQDDTG